MRTMLCVCMCAVSAFAVAPDKGAGLPPSPPGFPQLPVITGVVEIAVEPPRADVALDHIRSRPVTTQRMSRARGEMLAGIETEPDGRKVALVVHADGRTERRPVRVLATARVKPPQPDKGQAFPLGNAASAAAGAAAGLAAGLLAKKRT